MNTTSLRIPLCANDATSFPLFGRVRARVTRGRVWVTAPGGADLVLGEGEAFELGEGVVVEPLLSDAVLEVELPSAVLYGYKGRPVAHPTWRFAWHARRQA